MPESILRVEKVTKTFPGVVALNRVDFDLYPGEVHVIVGENGAGKSTLIKGIASDVIPPSEVLTRVNRELCSENTEAMFVTVFCGTLDLRTGELRPHHW